MLFDFLKYLQPTQYFSLKKKNGETVFPVYEHLPQVIKNQLQVDTRFESELAGQYDLSWQAVQKGYIGTTKTYKKIEGLSILDNYVFLRKYFSHYWVFYVLVLRVLSLKQPFKELSAYLKSRAIKRSDYLKTQVEYSDWENFNSELVALNPKVTVIIPTLNRYPYLNDVLNDLEAQVYQNFEVIIVDQSNPYLKEFYEGYKLDLTLIYQEEKALWLARNSAIKLSKGDYLLLFDDDSRVDKYWIINHLKCLDYFDAQISSGVSISKIGDKVPENYSFFRVSDQLDTGNVLIKKEVFKTIGLFDRQFEKQRMGDGEFGLRSYLEGFLNVSNPYAKRLHLKVSEGGLREMGSWDAFRTKNWTAPRPIPSVLYFFRTYFGSKATKKAILKTVPLSIMPYQLKANKIMKLIGVFVTLLIMPIVFFQVLKSWKLSSKKLEQGAIIETLS